MTQLVIDRHPLSLKLREVVRTVSGVQGAELVRVPTGCDKQDSSPDAAHLFKPYVVIYPLDDEDFFGGGLEAMESSLNTVYQMTSVGRTAVQAEGLADLVRSKLLGRSGGAYATSLNPAASAAYPSGLKVVGRWSLGRGAADPDSLLVSIPERFRFALTIP